MGAWGVPGVGDMGPDVPGVGDMDPAMQGWRTWAQPCWVSTGSHLQGLSSAPQKLEEKLQAQADYEEIKTELRYGLTGTHGCLASVPAGQARPHSRAALPWPPCHPLVSLPAS